MAFIDLENPKPSSGKRRPATGAMVSAREGGTQGRRWRYVAVLIGADAAKAINLHGSAVQTRVSLGAGEDAGRLRIMVQPGAKFEARRNKAGSYQITIRKAAIGDRLKDRFDTILIPKARVVPAQGQNPPHIILPVEGAFNG